MIRRVPERPVASLDATRNPRLLVPKVDHARANVSEVASRSLVLSRRLSSASDRVFRHARRAARGDLRASPAARDEHRRRRPSTLRGMSESPSQKPESLANRQLADARRDPRLAHGRDAVVADWWEAMGAAERVRMLGEHGRSSPTPARQGARLTPTGTRRRKARDSLGGQPGPGSRSHAPARSNSTARIAARVGNTKPPR